MLRLRFSIIFNMYSVYYFEQPILYCTVVIIFACDSHVLDAMLDD